MLPVKIGDKIRFINKDLGPGEKEQLTYNKIYTVINFTNWKQDNEPIVVTNLGLQWCVKPGEYTKILGSDECIKLVQDALKGINK